jgi:hypothetical protein
LVSFLVDFCTERVGVQFQSSTCGYPIFPAPFVEVVVLSLMFIFVTFVKNQFSEDLEFILEPPILFY